MRSSPHSLPDRSAPAPETIDIVIPHVDGSAPGYEALCRQHTGDFVPCHLRDLGELRFVLRSIEKYAPWGNVILVVQSEGHVPGWLDSRAVRIVYHHEFIPRELLPTFHWPTIAAHVNRISGLSPEYVYWEDDVLVGAPLRAADLFGPDHLLALNWASVPIPFGLGRFLGTYQQILEESRRALGRVLRRPVAAFLYPHAPLPATRASWARFYDAAIGDHGFHSTVTRRSRGDERAVPTIDPLVIYANWVDASMRRRGNGARRLSAVATVLKQLVAFAAPGSGQALQCSKYAVVNDEAHMRRNMARLRRAGARLGNSRGPVFFNVNDEAYDSWEEGGHRNDGSTLNPASAKLLLETLAILFPGRSRYEQADHADLVRGSPRTAGVAP
jgi:hypothetical protein